MSDSSKPYLDDTSGDSPQTSARCGMVAIVGSANAGKSTLINRILEEKISIVSPVAQTTRNLVRAILTEPRGQLVFLDTPGVHRATTDLGKIMNRTARAAVEGVDVAALVVDGARSPRKEDEGWMKKLARGDVPCLIVINKRDMSHFDPQPYKQAWADKGGQDTAATWHEVSAETGDGVDDLVAALFECMPVGPQLFPDDIVTDFPRKLTIADIVREKLFGVLRDELPHSIAVWIDAIDEDGDTWNVQGTVYVQRHSQKGIVIGEKGRLLRRVTRSAERELESIYERPIKLKLWVKVEPKWQQNHWILKQLGYRE